MNIVLEAYRLTGPGQDVVGDVGESGAPSFDLPRLPLVASAVIPHRARSSDDVVRPLDGPPLAISP